MIIWYKQAQYFSDLQDILSLCMELSAIWVPADLYFIDLILGSYTVKKAAATWNIFSIYWWQKPRKPSQSHKPISSLCLQLSANIPLIKQIGRLNPKSKGAKVFLQPWQGCAYIYTTTGKSRIGTNNPLYYSMGEFTIRLISVITYTWQHLSCGRGNLRSSPTTTEVIDDSKKQSINYDQTHWLRSAYYKWLELFNSKNRYSL